MSRPSDDIGIASTLSSGDEAGGAAVGAAPATIGRYRILRQLGAGGMGVVHAAHDPELGRTVAIKLVGERLGGEVGALRERLRREAQALARLDHPNVVPIYDAGLDGDRLYIVMLYVDGARLDDWIADGHHDRAAILSLYAQAGRGLAAIHAAGLVHRDFKPSNVLVERDGTVRVTDLGLVRLSHLADGRDGGARDGGHDDHDHDHDHGRGGVLGASMTGGSTVGTPAYMAPEQFSGGAITAATDQFGFCVALWEALVGARPFAGRDLATIREQVLAGAIVEPRGLPRRLERVLRRGLRVDPAQRFASMDALLAALAPRRRWWLATGAAVGLGAVATIAALGALGGGAPANPCGGAAAAIDDAWTPAIRERTGAALRARAAGDPGLVDDVLGRLDQRAAAWRSTRIEVCEATTVRRAQPAEVMTRRTSCLDVNLAAMREAIAILGEPATPGAHLEARAVTRAGGAPDDCSVEATSRGADAVVASELRLRVAQLSARASASDVGYVARIGPGLAAEAETSGDVSAAADAWYAVASIPESLSVDQARDAARKAALLQTQAGNDLAAARAWTWAVYAAANGGDLDACDDLLAMAAAEAARTDRADAALFVELARGVVTDERGDHEGARVICARAREAAIALGDPESDLIDQALACLAAAQTSLHQLDDALATNRELLALRTRTVGASAPIAIDTGIKLAILQIRTGDGAAGRREFATQVARLEAALGGDALPLMNAYSDLALATSEGGNASTPEAVAAAARALAIADRALPAGDPQVGRLLWIEANLLLAGDDPTAAAAAFTRALGIYERVSDDFSLGQLAFMAAESERRARRCDRAAPLYRRAETLATSGKTPPPIAPLARIGGAACALQQGDVTAAAAVIAPAVVEVQGFGDPDLSAEAELWLVELEWQQGRAPAARTRARRIHDAIADDSGYHRRLRQQIDAWYLAAGATGRRDTVVAP